MQERRNVEVFAEHLMRKYPRADMYPYKSWSYPQGFLLWGFIRLYEKTGREEYSRYVMDYCRQHVDEEGKICLFTGISLDDIMTASVIVWAYHFTGDIRYKKACMQVREAFKDYPRNPDHGFWHGKDRPGEMWVDGVFMGLMFLVRYGKYVEEESYCYGETIRQLSIIFDRCQKDKTGLLYHAYSEGKKAPWASKITGCSPEVWSEGLGWYALILAEVLAVMPEEWVKKSLIKERFVLLADSLLDVQDEGCGLWYQVVDKPGFPRNFHDTSGSAMFLYMLKKGMDLGVLQGEKYEQSVRRAYTGILSKCVTGLDGSIHVLDACNGLCVQDHYDIYVDYTKTVDAQEAVAAVLWALAAVELGTDSI